MELRTGNVRTPLSFECDGFPKLGVFLFGGIMDIKKNNKPKEDALYRVNKDCDYDTFPVCDMCEIHDNRELVTWRNGEAPFSLCFSCIDSLYNQYVVPIKGKING